MKRKMLFLGLIVSLCVAVGFTSYSVKVADIGKNNISENTVENENNKNESVIENPTQDVIKTQNTENATQENKAVIEDALSAEDKAVRAEIAKYSTDAADFRYNRKESIANKSYDLIFEKWVTPTAMKKRELPIKTARETILFMTFNQESCFLRE